MRTSGKHKLVLLGMLLEQQGNRCAICQQPLELINANIDHKIPRSKGGSNDQSNLQATHFRCNSDKGNRVD